MVFIICEVILTSYISLIYFTFCPRVNGFGVAFSLPSLADSRLALSRTEVQGRQTAILGENSHNWSVLKPNHNDLNDVKVTSNGNRFDLFMWKIKVRVQTVEYINIDNYQVLTMFFETDQLATLERETKKIRGVTSLGKQWKSGRRLKRWAPPPRPQIIREYPRACRTGFGQKHGVWAALNWPKTLPSRHCVTALIIGQHRLELSLFYALTVTVLEDCLKETQLVSRIHNFLVRNISYF